jgi:signal transduction histidine kinase
VRSEESLRRWALGLFGLVVAALVGYVAAGHGLADQPRLEHDVQVNVTDVFGVMSSALVGLWLTWARPRNPIGWWVSTAALMLVLCTLGQTYGARALVSGEGLPLGALALSLSAPLWIGTVFIPASMVLVRYPSGRITGTWPRRFERAVLAGLAVLWFGYATSAESVADEVPDALPPVLLPTPVGGTLTVIGASLLVVGTLLIVLDALRRVFRGDRAERPALFLLLLASVAAVTAIFFAPYEWMGTVSYFSVLVAMAVGVLRYKALGIDVVVRRALLYAILTGFVLLVFVGVVAVLASFIPSGPTPQIVAAVLIAVGLGPARDRVQDLIDHLLYGERNDPFAALQRLSAPVGAGDEDLLPGVLSALADALHAEGATVEAPGSAGIPLVFGGAEIGRLHVLPRRGEAALSRADQRLLSSVAPLIATVVHAARLADDLRVEQARVLEATQSERKRLRQELHDGLGPSLTGIGLGLEAAQRSGATEELLTRLRDEVTRSLEEVRRIIDDLHPSALDEQDLLAALRRRADQVTSAGGVCVDLDTPGHLPSLPPTVAAAAYRIADEALTNVVRHSSARHCQVRVSVGDRLRVEVNDDGVGPGDGREVGVGLVSMRERAERLGGRFLLQATYPGTSVLAELPLAVSP